MTDNKRPRKYWSDLKTKLQKEGSELSEKIGQLKLKSIDGITIKQRLKDEGNETVTIRHGLKMKAHSHSLY